MDITLRQPLQKPKESQAFGADFKWYNPSTGLWEWFYKQTYAPLMGHPGIDYACYTGTPIYSAHNGVCLYAGFDPVNGNLVQIYDEVKGFKTLYGHNSEIKVKQGDIIKAGQLIALSGNTGAGTGPHLHFGMKETTNGGNTKYPNNGFNGCIDPRPYFKQDYKGNLLNKDDMVFKKIKGEPSIYLVDDIKGTKTMIIDMRTLDSLGGKYEEVDNLAGYIPVGTLIYVERIID